ncbi:MAG TPA: V-type ATP synthase subunit I [Atribacteraceae bacterium]|nr:V-type ATP synthase subunit I [Atribacteraceae bacterium]
MAIKKMQRVDILVHQSLRDETFHLLQNMGVLEITVSEKTEDELHASEEIRFEELEHNLGEIRSALDFISKYSEKKPSPLENFFPPRLAISREDFLNQCFNYSVVAFDCAQLEEKLNRVRTGINRLSANLEFLRKIAWVPVALEDLGTTRESRSLLLEMDLEKIKQLKEHLQSLGTEWHLESFPGNGKRHLVLVVVHRVWWERLESYLQESSLTPITLPQAFEGTPAEAIQKIQNKIVSLEQDREQLIEEVRTRQKHEQELKISYDFLESVLEQRRKEAMALKTLETCQISGWARAEDIPRLEKQLTHLGREWVLFHRDPRNDEVVPIELKNNSWVNNFSVLTHLYGLPNYSEIDPTPLVAIFFFLFYGLCLGDVIYGVVLALAGFIAPAILKIPASSKLFFRMLAWGGIASIAVGLLTGSWLGDFFSFPPPALSFLGSIRSALMVIDPLINPLPMLIGSLLIGIFQILVGIFTGFLKEWKRGNRLVAIMDRLSWFIFIIAILLYIASMAFVPGLRTAATALVVVMVVFLIATQGRTKKNPIMKVLSGIMSLYGLVSYLGDVLSYSRLFALGLATTIVAVLARTLAELFGGAPYIGWLIGLFVFLLFHLFNIAMSGLGAFVHSARLVYVEFFTKFYESGGKKFQPFSYKTKYVRFADKT